VFKNKIKTVSIVVFRVRALRHQITPYPLCSGFSAGIRRTEGNLYIKSSSGKMLGFHSCRAANGAISVDDKSSQSQSGNKETNGVMGR